jgi:hypothetical protein
LVCFRSFPGIQPAQGFAGLTEGAVEGPTTASRETAQKATFRFG